MVLVQNENALFSTQVNIKPRYVNKLFKGHGFTQRQANQKVDPMGRYSSSLTLASGVAMIA